MSEASKPVLLPERRVAERYGVSWRALWRWLERPELDFPPVVHIGKRRFYFLAALEAWERENAKRAAARQPARSRKHAAGRIRRGTGVENSPTT